MISFREFFLETARGAKQDRSTSIFWKDARSGARPNVTYASNRQETNEEEKIIQDLRKRGGQSAVTPKMLTHITSKGINIPTQHGEFVHIGRSGDNTYHVVLGLMHDGKYVLKGEV